MKIFIFNSSSFLSVFLSFFLIGSIYAQDTLDITDRLISEMKEDARIFLKEGIYTIHKQIDIPFSNIYLSGESTKKVKIIFKSVKPNQEVLFKIIGNNITVQNITFDGNNSDVNVSLIQIGNSYGKVVSENIHIKNCCFQNVNGSIYGTDNAYGIRIFLNRSNHIKINSSNFKHISSYDKDQKSGSGGGFCGGIFLFSDQPMHRVNHINKIKIYNCIFDSIYTQNATKKGWDADGIRFYTDNTNPDSIKTSSIIIKNNTFTNVQKSAIKVSGVSGVRIKNTFISNSTKLEMLCPIRIQWGKNIIVKNTKISGNFEFGFNIIGQNIVLKKLRKIPNGQYVISKKIINYQNIESIENKNIKTIKVK